MFYYILFRFESLTLPLSVIVMTKSPRQAIDAKMRKISSLQQSDLVCVLTFSRAPRQCCGTFSSCPFHLLPASAQFSPSRSSPSSLLVPLPFSCLMRCTVLLLGVFAALSVFVAADVTITSPDGSVGVDFVGSSQQHENTEARARSLALHTHRASYVHVCDRCVRRPNQAVSSF